MGHLSYPEHLMKSKEEKQLRRGRAVHGVNITSENENL